MYLNFVAEENFSAYNICIYPNLNENLLAFSMSVQILACDRKRFIYPYAIFRVLC